MKNISDSVSSNSLSIFFDSNHAVTFDRFRRLNEDVMNIWGSVLSDLAYRNNEKPQVLDVGCGTGRFSLELCRKGCNVIGLDLSPIMLNGALDNAFEDGVMNFTGIVTSFEDFSTTDTFDLILISEMLHLVQNKFDFLKKAYMLTKVGGHITIRAPSHEQLSEREYYNFFYGALDKDIARHPDTQYITRILENCGFTDIHVSIIDESDTVDSNFYIASLKNKFHSTFSVIDNSSYISGIEKAEKTITGSIFRHMPITLIHAKRGDE